MSKIEVNKSFFLNMNTPQELFNLIVVFNNKIVSQYIS